MKRRARLAPVAGALLALALLLSGTGIERADTAPATQDAIWVASGGDLLKVAADSGQVLARPARSSDMELLAIDETTGVLWAYRDRTLSAFAPAGTLLLSIPIPGSEHKSFSRHSSGHGDDDEDDDRDEDDTAAALVVDSSDGSVWLALEASRSKSKSESTTLFRFDRGGTLLGSWKLSGTVRDLAVHSAGNRVWLGTRSAVLGLDEAGKVIVRPSLPKGEIRALAVDEDSGVLWVALDSALVRVRPDGAVIGKVSLSGVDRLAADGDHGVWATTGSSVLRIGPALQTLVRGKLSSSHHGQGLRALVADRRDHSAWLGGDDTVKHLRGDGFVLLAIHVDRSVRDLALAHGAPIDNRPPVAVNDSATTAVGTPVLVTVTGNDSDPDGDPLAISATSQGANGSVTHTATTATYTPAAGFHGTDTFTYTVGDGRGGAASATVTITVDQAPAVNPGPNRTITLPAAADLAGSVTDDGLPVPPARTTSAWSKVSGPGAVSFGDAARPATSAAFSQPGVYVLRLTASDGFLSASGDVQITVNEPSVANRPPAADAGLDQNVAVGVVVYLNGGGSFDPDSDPLTYSWRFTESPSPTAALADGDTPSPRFLADVAGSYTLELTVRDPYGEQSSVSVRIVASAQNHPPAVTSTPPAHGMVGQPYQYALAATDPDPGDSLTYSLVIAPDGMTIDPSTGAISWTPTVTQMGMRPVAVEVRDGRGGRATQEFGVNVGGASANRPPTAVDDQYSVRRRDTLVVPALGVLLNDTDPEGQPLSARLLTGPSKGSLALAPDGSFTYAPAEPPPGSTEPALKFAYVDATPGVTVTATQPLVIDLDGDGVPEIVFVALGAFGNCRLIAVHGDTGLPAFSINAFRPADDPPIVLCDPYTEMAAGDLDGDGFPEIVAIDGFDGGHTGDTFRRRLIVFNRDGTHKWTSDDVVDGSVVTSSSGFVKPYIVDLDGDGVPEIVVGHSGRGPLSPGVSNEEFVTVFDNQGRIRWTARGAGAIGGLSPSTGNLVVADLFLDGKPKILFSDDVWDHEGNLVWSAGTCPTCDPRVRDIAVANLDDDPHPEIVYLDAFGRLFVYEHTGVKRWGPITLPGVASTGTGLLTIADVDGDGLPEIIVARDQSIAVMNRDGSVMRSIPLPSSGFGGNVAVFDLNGDGKPEIIYQSALGPHDVGFTRGAVWIIDGQTGMVLHSIKASRGGGGVSAERGPIVADVDGDGTAEIVTGGWDDQVILHVFKAKNGQWARARPIYNQFAYHVTNVEADGRIPARAAMNWLTPGLNNFRINVPLPEERRGQDEDQFTYVASDGLSDSNAATVRIDLLPPNRSPRILSQPPTAASPGIEYLYPVRAVDPDVGEVLTFAAPQKPAGMTIDPSTGLVRWTPIPGQVGSHVVAIRVTDSQGQSVFQGYTVAVGAAVPVPSVLGQTQSAAQGTLAGAGLALGAVATAPSAAVPAGRVASQEPAAGAMVPASSAVAVVLSSGPQVAAVPNVVGQPQAAAQSAVLGAGLGIGTVVTAPSPTVPAGVVISQDPPGGTALALGGAVDMMVSIGAISLDHLASIAVEPASPTILVGQQFGFVATGVFDDGTSRDLTGVVGWSSSSGATAAISPLGLATGLADGATTVRASVNGISGSAGLTVRARVADATAPVATITSPAEDAQVTGPIPVTGTATDANFLKYILEYAPAGESAFVPLAEGTAPVVSGTLGSFDPSVLTNDQYTLRLTVFDRGGNTAESTVTVQVAREMKVGVFSLTFTDLNVPVPGLPITVKRVYDTRDKGQGDFGVGWRLGLETIRVRANRVLGTGWLRTLSGASFTLAPTAPHKVTVTLPGDKVEEFDMVVSPTSGFGALDFTTVTGFTPRPGTRGRLEALANSGLLILAAGPREELVDDSTLNTYDPTLFRYTSVDGVEFVVDRVLGLQSLKEPNGNTLTVGPGGIIHSSGVSALFQRDSEGRIVSLTDPRGAVQTYRYDVNGDLVGHTDPAGQSSQFFYDRRHDLIRMVDPLGRAVTRNEYDADGRLIATTDAAGNRITFSHDVAGRQEVVTDRLGRATVYTYDDQGNVLRSVNALGHATAFTYDAQGNTLSETNPLGHTTTFAYDAAGNLAARTDALGHATAYVYDARGQVLAITNPNGHTATAAYDTKSNLVTYTNPLGHATALTYDGAGNPLRVTDPLGNSGQNDYDGRGNRLRLTQAAAVPVTMSYDANGNLLEQTAAGLTQRMAYDPANRLTMATIGGLTRQVAYDAAGQMSGMITASGHQVNMAYDPTGRPTQIIRPDTGTAVGRTYDAEGNALSDTNLAGGVTSYTYDAADRLVLTTFPDGSTEVRVWDAADRLVQLTNQRGHTTRFEYDAADRLIRIIDPLGGVWSGAYDNAGNLVGTTDPLGRTTTYAYDAASRLTSTTFPGGGSEQRAYDAAGRLIQVTDAAGHATAFAYDPVGRLTAVTNALGGVTRYEYDAIGRRAAIVDANGNRTAFGYDGQGRLTTTTYPTGGVDSIAYDASGSVVATTNPNGETLQYTYDSLGRRIGLAFPGGTESYAHTADALLSSATDARGATTYAYDPATRRLIRATEPDGRYVRYAYDAAGNRTLMAHAIGGGPEEITRYAYDPLDRLSAVTAPDGGVTTYAYDAANNQTAIVRPNGITTLFTYDARNRPTSIVHRDAQGGALARFDYTLDAVGQRRVVREADGSRTEYDYDAAARVTAERRFDAANAPTGSVGYTYDAAGNLLARSGSLGDVAYTYNASSQLIAAGGTTYAYDAAGNLLTKTGPGNAVTRYTWDPFGKLVQFQPPVGGATTYAYDVLGNRRGKNGPGGAVTFLTDLAHPSGLTHVVREFDAGGNTIRSHLLGSQRLATIDAGATSYLHADGLGSTRLLTDATGAPTDTYAYAAYGPLLSHAGASTTPYLFAGERQDPESGLYHLRARYYDPAAGRFVSRDPLGGDAPLPLSLHKYLYAHDNPVNLVDPSGLFTLIEIQNTLKTQFQLYRDQLVRYRDKLDKAKSVIGQSAKIAGGIMAGTAVLETFSHMERPFLWFGLSIPRAGQGVYNTGRIALEMFRRQTRFDIGVFSFECFAIRDGGWAKVVHWKNQFQPGVGSRTNPAVVDLCGDFFGAPPMPVAAEGVAGRPSMAGVMVHEFSHVALGTADHEYGCAPPNGGLLGLLPGIPRALGPALAPEKSVDNADVYRCFVRDSWLGGGMLRFRKLVGIP